MRSAIAIAALMLTVGALTACASGDGEPVVLPSTAPVVTSAPTTVPPGTGPPTILPGTAAPTVAPGTPNLPTRDDATVDARAYQQRDNYYFQSPTGNIMCGILADAPFGFGCQLAHADVIPPQLPGCTDSPDRKVAVHIDGNTREFLCTSQGIFVGSPVDGTSKGGGATLNYGDTLVVRGVACTSSDKGIRCTAADHGFFLSTTEQTLF
ncbi:DUF6636 domain-containing protein [Nocardia sp. NPDC056064]|uniref:DUF6636 domain-containing protein n=1 Tax=Nocardia sp. NPDC056064 TaxID=3345701 RepID=UPI0035D637E8